jgi:hypothetical protein
MISLLSHSPLRSSLRQLLYSCSARHLMHFPGISFVEYRGVSPMSPIVLSPATSVICGAGRGLTALCPTTARSVISRSPPRYRKRCRKKLLHIVTAAGRAANGRAVHAVNKYLRYFATVSAPEVVNRHYSSTHNSRISSLARASEINLAISLTLSATVFL